MYTYVCMHMYKYTCLYTYMYTYTNMRVYIYIYIYVSVCVCLCVSVSLCVFSVSVSVEVYHRPTPSSCQATRPLCPQLGIPDCPSFGLGSESETIIWLWVKNRYPKWNPGKKHGLKPAVLWWFRFDTDPYWGSPWSSFAAPLATERSAPLPGRKRGLVKRGPAACLPTSCMAREKGNPVRQTRTAHHTSTTPGLCSKSHHSMFQYPKSACNQYREQMTKPKC